MRLIDADALEQEFTGCTEECACCTYSDEHLGIDKCRCKLITNAKTINEWISVKDRLPESGTVCLTYSPKGRMRVAKAFLPSTLPNSSYDPMECWWYLSGCGGRFVAVTHWMPLPDPPMEGEAG